ncbi:MAG: hypothetical protein WC054_02595 [Candidatus Nanopelagicales bacterium]
MTEIPIRELRNSGGEVADRVIAGENLTVTRAGTPVMELRAVREPTLAAVALIQRWRHVPAVSFHELREDLSTLIDDSV